MLHLPRTASTIQMSSLVLGRIALGSISQKTTCLKIGTVSLLDVIPLPLGLRTTCHAYHKSPIAHKCTNGKSVASKRCDSYGVVSKHVQKITGPFSITGRNQFNNDNFNDKHFCTEAPVSDGKPQNHNITEMSPNNFIQFMKQNKMKRCFVVFDEEKERPKSSHPELDEICQFFTDDTVEFQGHEGVFMELGKRTGCLMGTFIWKTTRGQAVSHLNISTGLPRQ